jgi:hypothetical protein
MQIPNFQQGQQRDLPPANSYLKLTSLIVAPLVAAPANTVNATFGRRLRANDRISPGHLPFFNSRI